MKRPVKRALIAVAVFAFVAMDQAEAQFTIIGQGTLSCGAWTAARRMRSGAGQQQWLLGFLSGVGFMGGPDVDPLANIDAEGVWAWVDNHCAANPAETLETAAVLFRFEHSH